MKHLIYFYLAAGLMFCPQFAKSQSYCTPPKYLTGPYTGITTVKVGDINNTTSSDDGYTDYTATAGACNLKPGASTSLSLTCYYDPSMLQFFTGKLNVRVWIDWNGNGSFADAGEMALADTLDCTKSTTSNSLVSMTYTIKVPMGAKPGLTRMRVYEDMMPVDGHEVPNPCGYDTDIGQHGECEDYKVNVTNGSAIDENIAMAQPLGIFPNPAQSIIVIKLPVTPIVSKLLVQDISGKTIKQLDIMAGTQQLQLDIADLPKGVYILSVNSCSRSKLILE